jgi:UDP-N-acetylglucosamine 2-epimerase (non-hydrolysing)
MLDRVFEHRLVHTGQNFDKNLSDIFFEELEIRSPDYYLGVRSSTLATGIGDVLVGVEAAVKEFQPEAMLILGDTNSALSALIAKRTGVTVYHLEAGNRSFDINVPEETNRKIVDSISDFNLAYSEHARRNLLAEGHPPRHVTVTGSPMKEVLTHYEHKISHSDVLGRLNLAKKQYFLLSAHRQENIDDPQRLSVLLQSVSKLSEEYGIPTIVSTHPRLLARISDLGGVARYPLLQFLPPFGFFDFQQLQMNARCVLSDSGTISEEAAILNFPAVTIRDSMERPEALEVGSVVMSGIQYADIQAAVAFKIENLGITAIPDDYLPTDFSQRVVSFMLSTLGRIDFWTGRRRHKGSIS